MVEAAPTGWLGVGRPIRPPVPWPPDMRRALPAPGRVSSSPTSRGAPSTVFGSLDAGAAPRFGPAGSGWRTPLVRARTDDPAGRAFSPKIAFLQYRSARPPGSGSRSAPSSRLPGHPTAFCAAVRWRPHHGRAFLLWLVVEVSSLFCSTCLASTWRVINDLGHCFVFRAQEHDIVGARAPTGSFVDDITGLLVSDSKWRAVQ